MGTFYTIVTEIIRDKDKADQIEDRLIKESKQSRLQWKRIEIESKNYSCYFTIYDKSIVSGWYDDYYIDARCVWIDDEGGFGSNE